MEIKMGFVYIICKVFFFSDKEHLFQVKSCVPVTKERISVTGLALIPNPWLHKGMDSNCVQKLCTTGPVYRLHIEKSSFFYVINTTVT